MPELPELLDDLFGGDPVAGNEALSVLVALGAPAEAAFLARPIRFLNSVQQKRRVLRYIASRETLAEALLERTIDPRPGDDHDAVAFLLAAVDPSRFGANTRFCLISRAFTTKGPTDETMRDPSSMTGRLLGWGFAGGEASILWQYIPTSHFGWDKFKVFAFRSACAACARVDVGGLWALENLITHEWPDLSLHGLTRIDSDQLTAKHESVDLQELGSQADLAFYYWRRGDVADAVLNHWAGHEHVRVRYFGAQILGSLALQRTVKSLQQWLSTEPSPEVRRALLRSLGRIGTKEAADALLAACTAGMTEARSPFALLGWRATNQAGAREILLQLARDERRCFPESVVSLAKLRLRAPQLESMLESTDPYERLNAALAGAYLGDATLLARLPVHFNEASSTLERLVLLAAMSIGGREDAAPRLQAALADAAANPKYEKRLDFFYLHAYLRTAMLDGLRAGGAATARAHAAWLAEAEALEPITTPWTPAPALEQPTAPEVPPVPAPESAASASAPEPAAGPTPPPPPSRRAFDWLACLQIIDLALGFLAVVGFALVTQYRGLTWAFLAPAASYLAIVWALRRKPDENWWQRLLVQCVAWTLSTTRRATVTGTLLVAGILAEAWLLYGALIEPNYVFQIFRVNLQHPVAQAELSVKDLRSEKEQSKLSDEAGHVKFRIDTSHPHQYRLVVAGQPRRSTVQNLTVKADGREAIDISSIPKEQWQELQETGPGLEFSTLKTAVLPSPQPFEVPPPNRVREPQWPWGYPAAAIRIQEPAYLLGFDSEKKIPRWVGFRITAGTNRPDRSIPFSPDPRIPSQVQANTETFAGRGWVRGQLISSAEVSGFTGEQIPQLNSYALVVPQDPVLNAGFWAMLEAHCVKLAAKNPTWVMAGPVFKAAAGENHLEYLELPNAVAVPTHLFRIVVRRRADDVLEAQAFLVPNQPIKRTVSLQTYIVPVAAIEAATGLQFFGGLSDPERERLRTTVTTLWE